MLTNVRFVVVGKNLGELEQGAETILVHLTGESSWMNKDSLRNARFDITPVLETTQGDVVSWQADVEVSI